MIILQVLAGVLVIIIFTGLLVAVCILAEWGGL